MRSSCCKNSAEKVPWHEIRKVTVWLWQQELIINAYALCRQTAVGYKWLVEVNRADSDRARRGLKYMKQKMIGKAF